MAEQQYPENEKLSVERSEWATLVDYMEFLSAKGIQLMKWVEREYEEPCNGTILTDCLDGFYARNNFVTGELEATKRACETCHGTGVVTKHFKGYEPVSLADNRLIYEHLQVDPKKLESERRAMLSSLGS